jgi:O-antigen/teichoic acid export membrane protein
MLRFSAPLVPSAIAVWVSSYMDRLMIKHFLSLEEVGLYGIGFRLSSMVTLVMIGFQMALSPLIYSNYEKTETPGEIARIFRFFNALCLLVFAGINLFAEDLLIFFTQPLYFDARKVIIFLVPSIMLSQMYVFAPGIFIKKKSGYVIWINVVGACLNAILNWFMIPWLGFTGAAIATMISQIFVFSIYMYFSQLFYNVPHQWRKHFVASVLVVSIVLLAYPLSLSGIWHWIYCFVALLLTFLAFVVSGLVSASEINEFYIKVKTSKWFKFLNDK